jgi:hypothetical protein
LKHGKAQEMARDTAHKTAEQILSSNTWKKPALYDVVYRIPDASLKLARDDRQAGLWYKEERKNAEKGIEATKNQPLAVIRTSHTIFHCAHSCPVAYHHTDPSHPFVPIPPIHMWNACAPMELFNLWPCPTKVPDNTFDHAPPAPPPYLSRSVAQDGPTWVSITLNGRAVNVLVDDSGQRVLAQREADPRAVMHTNGSGLDV